jgi:hypothetical protein
MGRAPDTLLWAAVCWGLAQFAIVAVSFTGYFRFFELEFDMSNKL